MKKIKFLIIGSRKLQNTVDLIEEITSLGHEVNVVNIKKIVFESKNGKFSFCSDGMSLEDYDIYIIRKYGTNLSKARLIINKLKGKKIIIDEVLSEAPIFDKMYQASCFANVGIPHPQTIEVVDKSLLKKSAKLFTFPVIVKPVSGSRGSGVYKANSLEEVYNVLDIALEEYIIQQYIPIKNDVRVFVVGDKVLGAISRYVLPNDCRSNASLGAKVEECHITKDMANLAIRSVQALKLDVAGVDMVENDGEWLLLEVNISPQWQAFKKNTGINPAKNIIAHALKKYEKNKHEKAK